MWQSGWKGNLGENGYMCIYHRVPTYLPETITTYLICYTPIQNKKVLSPLKVRIFICLVSDIPQLFSIMPNINGGWNSKESAHNARNQGLIPGSERYSGEGNGYPLQYSCLENSMDRGTWWTTVHGVSKSHTHQILSLLHFKWPVIC